MPDTYVPPPKRVTFAFEDVGSGRWRTVIEITAPNGSVRRAASEYRRDGKAVQAEGDTAEADSAAFSSPAPNVLVMSLAKDKGLASRSEEHTSELQSLMRISYAVFCLKKKHVNTQPHNHVITSTFIMS